MPRSPPRTMIRGRVGGPRHAQPGRPGWAKHPDGEPGPTARRRKLRHRHQPYHLTGPESPRRELRRRRRTAMGHVASRWRMFGASTGASTRPHSRPSRTSRMAQPCAFGSARKPGMPPAGFEPTTSSPSARCRRVAGGARVAPMPRSARGPRLGARPRAQAPRRRAARRRRRGRSACGSRVRARLASSCGSGSCPRR